jgi:hypothetical protein
MPRLPNTALSAQQLLPLNSTPSHLAESYFFRSVATTREIELGTAITDSATDY